MAETEFCKRLDAYIEDEEKATQEYLDENIHVRALGSAMFLKMSSDEASHAQMLKALKAHYCGGK